MTFKEISASLETILNDNKFTPLSRIDSRVTGNVKLTIDYTGELSLNMIHASPNISTELFKDYKITGESLYSNDLVRFLSPLKKKFSPFYTVSNKSSDYDTGYKVDTNTYFYPIQLPLQYQDTETTLLEKFPDFFILFEIDKTDTVLNNSLEFQKILKKYPIKYTWDMRASSKIGTYLRNIYTQNADLYFEDVVNGKSKKRNFSFLEKNAFLPIYDTNKNFVDYALTEYEYSGIGLIQSTWISKISLLRRESYFDSLFSIEQIQQNYIDILLKGYETNSIVSGKIVNLEFRLTEKFDTDTKMCVGFYVYSDTERENYTLPVNLSTSEYIELIRPGQRVTAETRVNTIIELIKLNNLIGTIDSENIGSVIISSTSRENDYYIVRYTEITNSLPIEYYAIYVYWKFNWTKFQLNYSTVLNDILSYLQNSTLYIAEDSITKDRSLLTIQEITNLHFTKTDLIVNPLESNKYLSTQKIEIENFNNLQENFYVSASDEGASFSVDKETYIDNNKETDYLFLENNFSLYTDFFYGIIDKKKNIRPIKNIIDGFGNDNFFEVQLYETSLDYSEITGTNLQNIKSFEASLTSEDAYSLLRVEFLTSKISYFFAGDYLQVEDLSTNNSGLYKWRIVAVDIPEYNQSTSVEKYPKFTLKVNDKKVLLRNELEVYLEFTIEGEGYSTYYGKEIIIKGDFEEIKTVINSYRSFDGNFFIELYLTVDDYLKIRDQQVFVLFKEETFLKREFGIKNKDGKTNLSIEYLLDNIVREFSEFYNFSSLVGKISERVIGFRSKKHTNDQFKFYWNFTHSRNSSTQLVLNDTTCINNVAKYCGEQLFIRTKNKNYSRLRVPKKFNSSGTSLSLREIFENGYPYELVFRVNDDSGFLLYEERITEFQILKKTPIDIILDIQKSINFTNNIIEIDLIFTNKVYSTTYSIRTKYTLKNGSVRLILRESDWNGLSQWIEGDELILTNTDVSVLNYYMIQGKKIYDYPYLDTYKYPTSTINQNLVEYVNANAYDVYNLKTINATPLIDFDNRILGRKKSVLTLSRFYPIYSKDILNFEQILK